MAEQPQLWSAGPVRISSDQQAKQRVRDQRKKESGANRRRMERRQAAKYGLSVERYREMRALAAIFSALRRAASRPSVLVKRCKECGRLFETTLLRQILCGDSDCRRKYVIAYVLTRYHSDPEFRSQVIARQHSRRARDLGLGGTTEANLVYLLDRDGWRCGICRRKIKSFDQASIDHIVPLSRGGTHELANVQASHKKCNYGKGNRGGGEQTRLIG